MDTGSDTVVTPLTAEDVDVVQWAVYTAVAWNSPPGLPPLEQAIEHPELARYHRDWGRVGDIGVKATVADQFAGAVFARLFTEADHGHGYVDSLTPELGIAVVAEHRGQGVGRRLMRALEDRARREGFERLALSVNNPNPAKRLYEWLGYRTVGDDGESSIMVLHLDRPG